MLRTYNLDTKPKWDKYKEIISIGWCYILLMSMVEGWEANKKVHCELFGK